MPVSPSTFLSNINLGRTNSKNFNKSTLSSIDKSKYNFEKSRNNFNIHPFNQTSTTSFQYYKDKSQFMQHDEGNQIKYIDYGSIQPRELV